MLGRFLSSHSAFDAESWYQTPCFSISDTIAEPSWRRLATWSLALILQCPFCHPQNDLFSGSMGLDELS